MIRARRAGIKTQTRRVVKSLRHPFGNMLPPEEVASEFNGLTEVVSCPYGKPGDRLIVKEAAWMWCAKVVSGLTKKTKKPKVCWLEARNVPPIYCADHPEKPSHIPNGQTVTVGAVTYEWRKKIARFLPAWASRDTLEITGIRVERLHDISKEDAIAEGVGSHNMGKYVPNSMLPMPPAWYAAPESEQWTEKWHPEGCPEMVANSTMRNFINVWENINGCESWLLNPFVWVVEFKRFEKGLPTGPTPQ